MSDALSLRHATLLADRRREWRGSGGAVPEKAKSILTLARGGKRCKWDGLGRRVGRGCDQVDVESLLWAAVESGLVIISERKDRRRDWGPYQWRLTEEGEVLVARKEEVIDVVGYLAQADDPNHPVLAAIRIWLELAGGSTMCTRLVIAIGDELRAGRVPRERLLSKKITGFSKAFRIDEYRVELEDALGLPLDAFVRKSGDSAIVAGPIRFRVGGIETDARGVPPWLALPIETVEAIEWMSIGDA